MPLAGGVRGIVLAPGSFMAITTVGEIMTSIVGVLAVGDTLVARDVPVEMIMEKDVDRENIAPPASTGRRRCALDSDGGSCRAGVGNDDPERGALLRRLESDGPAVGFRDSPAEGQAEPAPLRLGGEERFEDLLA